MSKNLKYSAKLFFTIIFFTSIFLTSCNTKNEKKTDWTILIYMAADNSLNENAIADIEEEMVAANFSDDINILVQIDHRNDYPVVDYTGAERYLISSGEKKIISQIGEIDSGSSEEMASFIDWGTTKYPSEKKALFLWSHGNGWYDSYNKFCPDNTSQSSINIPEGELHRSLELSNTHFEIIVFDACNMQTIEVVTEVAEFTDFVIGSEEAIKSDGFPYDKILESWEDFNSTESIALNIKEKFIESYKPFGGSQNEDNSIFKFSCSVAKTELFSELLTELTTFSNNSLENWTVQEILTARTECLELNDPEIDIDLYQFFSLLENISSKDYNVVSKIDDIFISSDYFKPSENQYFIEYVENAGYAAIWFPEDVNILENLNPVYHNLRFAETNWSGFLEQVLARQSRNLATNKTNKTN
ncbi:MAG: hypothetical protein K8S23_03600 [Candidatus Cloacimonetes bacterium]|nr:hypothetical protein [Candidatus Cloacimonadota bacterium]